MGLAILVSSVIDVNPVEAQYRNKWIQDGWVEVLCLPEGCTWVKKIGGTWPRIAYFLKAPAAMGPGTFERDCKNWRVRAIGQGYKYGYGKWNPVMPGTIGVRVHNVVCHPQFK